jgi:hypothetical protein
VATLKDGSKSGQDTDHDGILGSLAVKQMTAMRDKDGAARAAGPLVADVLR